MHERDALAVRLGMLEAKLDETRVERGQVGAGLLVAACVGSAHGALLSAASRGAVHCGSAHVVAWKEVVGRLVLQAESYWRWRPRTRRSETRAAVFINPNLAGLNRNLQAESYRVLAAQSEEKRARAEDELLTTARLVSTDCVDSVWCKSQAVLSHIALPMPHSGLPGHPEVTRHPSCSLQLLLASRLG